MSTYSAMRSKFIALLNRSDCADANAALVKDWFDSAIGLIDKEVRWKGMERTLTIDTTNAVDIVPVPTDWLQTIALVWDNTTTDSGEIDPVDLGTYYRRKNEIFDVPTIYTREVGNFLINAAIPAAATAKLIYYGNETKLVNDSDETDLAKQAPDLIIRAALVFAATYFIDDRKDSWQAEFEFLREQLQTQATDGDSHDVAAIQPFVEFDDHV